jgi:hypothetical protein
LPFWRRLQRNAEFKIPVFVRLREGCSVWRPSFRRSRPIALRRQRNVMASADLAQADVGTSRVSGLD